jgi:diguanylate cyclase (GGDEF)-like protein
VSIDPARPSIAIGDVLATGVAAVARDEPGTAIQSVIERMVTAVGATRAAVAARDPDGRAITLVADVGFDDELRAAGVEVLADPTAAPIRAMAERTAAFDRAADHDPAALHADLPLVVAVDGVERAVGVLTVVYPAAQGLGPDDRAALGTVADLLAIAVDRARLSSMALERSEWLERLANVDPLTGVANARMLGRVLELEVARASRQGGEVSVAVFDIDGFAELNDRSGRPAGDDALRHVAEVLGGSIRLVDTVARTGADEFVVVAPGSAGPVVARRVVEAVTAIAGASERGLSVSAGLAEFPRDGTSADELLAVARPALNEARAGGPGRVAGSGRA